MESVAETQMRYSELLSSGSHELITTTASSLAQSLETETAGILIISELTQFFDKSSNRILLYLGMVKHLLSEETYSFMSRHEKILNSWLSSNNHMNFYDCDFFSASTLISAYLLKPFFGARPCETPVLMKLRIAVHLFSPDLEDVKRCFETLLYNFYTPASPTLISAGLRKSQGSSCFLVTVDDSIHGLLGTGVYDVGVISQHKGGVGIGLSNIRHSAIGYAGHSDGVVPFMRIMDKTVASVNQGGNRPGAGTAFLDIKHIDIKDFINCTNNFRMNAAQRISHLNTCVWMHDLFYERVRQDGNWTVFCPAKAHELNGKYGVDFETLYLEMEKKASIQEKIYERAVEKLEEVRNNLTVSAEEVQRITEEAIVATRNRIEHKVYPAKELLDQIINVERSSGFPYVMNGDSINAKSNQSNVGSVNSGNLCVEIVEVSDSNSIASCNLSSISLKAFVDTETKTFDFKKLGEITRQVVRNLNKLIDKNYYPLSEKTEKINMTRRPMGIGVSGFSDAVQMMDFVFESPETERLNKLIFGCMYFNALLQSLELAIQSGEPYADFRTGQWTLERADIPEVSERMEFSQPVRVEESKCGNGIFFETYHGSPLSCGFFQFDLWRINGLVKNRLGRINHEFYNLKDDIPLNPTEWGQETEMVASFLHVPPSWSSLRSAIRTFGVKNSLFLTVMPTASTAQILRNSESTEIHAANIYTRSVNSGRFTIVNSHLVNDLKELEVWDRTLMDLIVAFRGSVQNLDRMIQKLYPRVFKAHEARINHLIRKYKTMFEVKQRTVMKYARQRGIYICQSQSMNIYLRDPSQDQMRAVHMAVYDLGLKSLYYLRQESETSATGITLSPEILALRDELSADYPYPLSSPSSPPFSSPSPSSFPSPPPPSSSQSPDESSSPRCVFGTGSPECLACS